MGIEKRLTTSIIALSVAAVVIGAGGGIPVTLSMTKLQEQTAVESQKIETAYAMRRITESTVNTVADVNRRIRALGPVAIIEGQELDFINAMETIAAESQVTQNIELITADQEELSKYEKNVPLKINVEGDYLRVIEYFRKLDRLPYYLAPRNLRISIPSQREYAGDGRVRATYDSMIRWLSKDNPAFQPFEQ